LFLCVRWKADDWPIVLMSAKLLNREFWRERHYLLDEQMVKSFERLMCEVEFWEVFLGNVQGFLDWLPQGARC
jgi:hypothetical protein